MIVRYLCEFCGECQECCAEDLDCVIDEGQEVVCDVVCEECGKNNKILIEIDQIIDNKEQKWKN